MILIKIPHSSTKPDTDNNLHDDNCAAECTADAMPAVHNIYMKTFETDAKYVRCAKPTRARRNAEEICFIIIVYFG